MNTRGSTQLKHGRNFICYLIFQIHTAQVLDLDLPAELVPACAQRNSGHEVGAVVGAVAGGGQLLQQHPMVGLIVAVSRRLLVVCILPFSITKLLPVNGVVSSVGHFGRVDG